MRSILILHFLQIDQLMTINHLSNMDEMRQQLKLKTRSLIQMQHTIDAMRQQCRQVFFLYLIDSKKCNICFRHLKEQKDNATLLLVDMSRDMSELLDAVKNL